MAAILSTIIEYACQLVIRKLFVFFLIITWSTFCSAQNLNVAENSKFNRYREKYKSDCLLEKITNNTGDGYEELYGTRNFRVVLHGVAYRGGGNNYYHRTKKRSNKNPLPKDGLENLLRNGFSSAIYLYSEKFETAPRFISNQTRDTLNYYQIGGNTEEEIDSILRMTYSSIMNEDKGPIYLHCWNGWHQSGFVSAVLLKQFCGFNTETSLNYWEDGADNLSKGYTRIKDAIRDFKPVKKYLIPQKMSKVICPCYENGEIVDSREQEFKPLVGSVSFPSNVSDLPPQVSTFLDEYAKTLIRNAAFSMEVGGYTDSRGMKLVNRNLSENRAKNVYNYLVKQGVDSLQLSYKGYGESGLKNKCSDNIQCSEKLHSENRRVEFKVMSISAHLKFEQNSVEISSDDKQLMSNIKHILSSDSTISLKIAGHSDRKTDSSYEKTAALRAKTVYNYLRDSGVNESKIIYLGYGADQPVYNDFRDRRVEFKVIR